MLQASLLEHFPAALFVFVLGSCLGSFLNVVIYRLPRNMRLLTPPSCCPSCNHKLRFFRENLPIIGWLAIRGKCRYCKAPVSFEYPFIELLTGVLFLLSYVLCYWVPTSTPFLGAIFGDWWHVNGIYKTFPMFLALVSMVGGLLAMTIIDARTYTIPIQIPIFMTVVAFCAAIVQSLLPLRHTPNELWAYPLVDWTWASAAIGGMFGVFLTSVLLKLGVLPHSFSDYEEYVQGDEIIAQYPYARREMLKEIVVLCPIIMGFVVGFMIGYERGFPPLLVQVLGGSMLGYLVGGGLVWGIRILGTLGFGREAMGLGDVHLLAGVGAVVGWWDPILIFFIAPFSGLLWAASTAILAKMGKKSREIPYGPHLAIATLVVVFLRPGLNWAWTIAMPGVLQPSIENVQIIKSGDDFISMRIFVEYLQGMDLTDGLKEGSIPISPHVVGCDRVRQDVSLVCGL